MGEILVALAVAAAVATIGLLTAFLALPSLAKRNAAKLGVSTSRSSLRALSQLQAVMFDKHGTITTGELKVVSLNPIRPDADRDLRWFAGALEHHSEHPVGRAIAKLSARGNVKNVQEVAGYGISGSVDRHPVRVGKPAWLGVDAVSEVGAVVAVEVDSRIMGTMTVADEVIPEISSVMNHLHTARITPILVTSDAVVAAKDLAHRSGIDHLLPDIRQEGLTHTEGLVREQHGSVAAIRDGGKTIHLDDDVCAVTPGHNPLRALADVVEVARSIPRQARATLVVAAGFAVGAGVVAFIIA